MDARILVVEDDLTVAEVVTDYLRHAGLESRHVPDGLTALEIAATWQPDLVVLDLMLPGVGGLEVCRRLRAAEGTRALPVIMRAGTHHVGEDARMIEQTLDIATALLRRATGDGSWLSSMS